MERNPLYDSVVEQIAEDLRGDEGEKLSAYQDSRGYWTIGIGRLIDSRMGGRITPEESAMLLKNDIRRVFAELDTRLPWWREMTINRRRVIVNMAFNLGISRLLGFRATLAAMGAGDYEGAAAGMLDSRWATQVGDRAKRLAALMRNG